MLHIPTFIYNFELLGHSEVAIVASDGILCCYRVTGGVCICPIKPSYSTLLLQTRQRDNWTRRVDEWHRLSLLIWLQDADVIAGSDDERFNVLSHSLA